MPTSNKPLAFIAGTAGLAAVILFFQPWVSIQYQSIEQFNWSGWDLATQTNYPWIWLTLGAAVLVLGASCLMITSLIPESRRTYRYQGSAAFFGLTSLVGEVLYFFSQGQQDVTQTVVAASPDADPSAISVVFAWGFWALLGAFAFATLSSYVSGRQFALTQQREAAKIAKQQRTW